MADANGAKPRRVWRIVLVISLMLNVAVVGIVAGFALRGKVGDGPPRGFDLSLGPVTQALDPRDRRAIGRTMRQRDDLRPLRREDMQRLVGDIIAALQAETFSQPAFRAALDAPGERLAAVQAAAKDALAVRVAAMTPQERQAFAARLAERLERRKSR